jgi:hypothetical protein
VSRECCPAHVHDRMRADPVLFLACVFIGFQRMAGFPTLMLRNCKRCHGTLSLRLSTVMEMYPLTVVGVAELIKEYVS